MVKKTVLITGSASGIGYGIAESFAKSGFDVFLHGLISREDGMKMASELSSKYKVKAFYKNADLKNREHILSLITEAEQSLNGLGVLINNAGMQKVARVEEFGDDDWNDVIAVDLSAAFFAIKYSLPHMLKRKYGRIINIASVHGLVASEKKVAYVAAKHGIIGMTKVVALENANTGITCNSICPGWVNTPLVREQIEAIAKTENISIAQAQENLLTEKHPMKKFVEIDELAETALYICRIGSMTGSSVVLDCGWTSR